MFGKRAALWYLIASVIVIGLCVFFGLRSLEETPSLSPTTGTSPTAQLSDAELAADIARHPFWKIRQSPANVEILAGRILSLPAGSIAFVYPDGDTMTESNHRRADDLR